MPPKAKKLPTPDELLAEVKGQGAAKTYAFEDYIQVVHHMQENGYSYAKIAEFLSEKLGYKISRGQVYRAYQLWLEELEEGALADADAREGEAPPDAEEHYDREIAKLATDIREYAEKRALEKGLHPEFGEHAISEAARIIELLGHQKRLDDAAADAADSKRAKVTGSNDDPVTSS